MDYKCNTLEITGVIINKFCSFKQGYRYEKFTENFRIGMAGYAGFMVKESFDGKQNRSGIVEENQLEAKDHKDTD